MEQMHCDTDNFQSSLLSWPAKCIRIGPGRWDLALLKCRNTTNRGGLVPMCIESWKRIKMNMRQDLATCEPAQFAGSTQLLWTCPNAGWVYLSRRKHWWAQCVKYTVLLLSVYNLYGWVIFRYFDLSRYFQSQLSYRR
jgi:hypothetical protein